MLLLMLLGDCDAVTALLLFVTAVDRVPTAGAGRRRRPKPPPASAATLIHSTARRNDVVLNFCWMIHLVDTSESIAVGRELRAVNGLAGERINRLVVFFWCVCQTVKRIG